MRKGGSAGKRLILHARNEVPMACIDAAEGDAGAAGVRLRDAATPSAIQSKLALRAGSQMPRLRRRIGAAAMGAERCVVAQAAKRPLSGGGPSLAQRATCSSRAIDRGHGCPGVLVTVRPEVAVGVEGGLGRRVPQPRLDDLDVEPRSDEQRGEVVA